VTLWIKIKFTLLAISIILMLATSVIYYIFIKYNCPMIVGASLDSVGGSAGSALGEWGGEQLYETFGN
jgi:hypothetical protein